jgi:hypothetical protein
MEKNTLTFDNTGFVYDVDNPTQQTEELAYILKGALLSTSPLNIRQYDDDEFAEVYSKTIDIADELGNICTQLESIVSLVTSIDATLTDDMSVSLLDMSSQLYELFSEIEDLSSYLTGEEEESEDLLSAINNVAASTGIFMDAPGLSIIDKPELL